MKGLPGVIFSLQASDQDMHLIREMSSNQSRSWAIPEGGPRVASRGPVWKQKVLWSQQLQTGICKECLSFCIFLY